jgi:hypothetical protein
MGMFLATDALSLEGELSQWERVSERGISNIRFSCSRCGNIIYGIGGDMPALIKLQPGTLDGDEAIHPEVHLWTRSAQSWFEFPPHAPQFTTQPDDADELLKAVAIYRQRLAAEAAGKSPGDQ